MHFVNRAHLEWLEETSCFVPFFLEFASQQSTALASAAGHGQAPTCCSAEALTRTPALPSPSSEQLCQCASASTRSSRLHPSPLPPPFFGLVLRSAVGMLVGDHNTDLEQRHRRLLQKDCPDERDQSSTTFSTSTAARSRRLGKETRWTRPALAEASPAACRQGRHQAESPSLQTPARLALRPEGKAECRVEAPAAPSVTAPRARRQPRGRLLLLASAHVCSRRKSFHLTLCWNWAEGSRLVSSPLDGINTSCHCAHTHHAAHSTHQGKGLPAPPTNQCVVFTLNS